MKAQVDIVADKQVIFKDTKVTPSQQALLEKLKIYPFSYKMEVKQVLQGGSVFAADVLDLAEDIILEKFQKAVHHQTSLSLGVGVPTKLSAPHHILRSFKNLVAVAHTTEFEFPQASAMLTAAKSAPAQAAGAAPAKADEKPKKEEKVRRKKRQTLTWEVCSAMSTERVISLCNRVRVAAENCHEIF